MDVVYYLFSYLSNLSIKPSYQAEYFQTLSSTKYICLSFLGSQIYSNNLNPRLLSLLLTFLLKPTWWHRSCQLFSQQLGQPNLVCKMTLSLACNCKAIKRNSNPNRIESRKVTSQQMEYWWVGIKTIVKWQADVLLNNAIAAWCI